MEFKECVEARLPKSGVDSLRQLARNMGFHPNSITRMMKNPTFGTMKRFAEALNCDLWVLLKPVTDDEDDVRKVDKVFIQYSDGGTDSFTRDSDVVE
jgi:lambda repressor-like predicted transcriptional regulator